MKLSADKVKALSRKQGKSLSEVLRRAGVSRTAFYSLARRNNVLPKTVIALSTALDVSEVEILEPTPQGAADGYEERLAEARAILDRSPEVSFENVWHALCLLDLDPVERLNRSLIRGRATAIHG